MFDIPPRKLLWMYCPGYVQVQCCCTSTETIRLTKDGKPRRATWTFTQLLSSALDMPETNEINDKADRLAVKKQPSQVACVSDDLKC